MLNSSRCAFPRHLRRRIRTCLAVVKTESTNSNASYSTSHDEYQFIQRGLLPMNHFQSSLPRLPIPKLEKTIERYLNAQRPLLTDEDFNRCKKTTQQFLTEAKGLDVELRDRDKKNKYTSYVTKPWFDMYLKDRRSTVITHNPGIIFNPHPKPEYNTQRLTAANMLVSSLRFWNSLRHSLLEPDVFHLNPKKSDNINYRKVLRWIPSPLRFGVSALAYKAFPLDMSQFVNLMNSTRIPEVSGKDTLLADPESRHMVVMRNGHFYVFDATDSSGEIKSPEEILCYIDYILSDNSPAAAYPVGVLTTQDRDTWAKQRVDLVNAGNAEKLALVDTAIFCLNLDILPNKEDKTILRNFLHADGTNRWFDKSFQLMISDNGLAAVNFEHAWGDGVAVLRYLTEIYKDFTENPRLGTHSKPANIDPKQHVRKIEWNIPDNVKQGIDNAKLEFKKRTSSLNIDLLEYTDAAKGFIKQQKLSPDAFMQMAFQVAYHRVTGTTVPTYESCSTAAFKNGRTETIRPATVHTRSLSEALNSNNKPSPKEVRKIIQQCSNYHSKLTKGAAMGQGFDRHLFCLKLLAEEKGETIPGLYRDPAYNRINHNVISTSTLGVDFIYGGAFAPVVRDGLGVAYGIQDERLGCVATSFEGCNSSRDFASSLLSVFDDLVQILKASYKP